jgi:hypothetical protein
MLQYRVFRTGLLATALVTAIAVPAAAAPAAPEAGTVVVKKNKPVRRAAAVPQLYTLKAEIEAAMSGEATGTIEWDDTSFQVRGATIKDNGAGRSTITYELTGKAGVTPQKKEFLAETETGKPTNFSLTATEIKGLESLKVTVCKSTADPATGNVKGVCRFDSFDPKSTASMSASRKAGKHVAKKARKGAVKNVVRRR